MLYQKTGPTDFDELRIIDFLQTMKVLILELQGNRTGRDDLSDMGIRRVP